jgi:PhnB protein
MATKPKPIPDSYPRVTPALVLRGANKALEFYAQVFAASERMRFPGPGDSIAHAEIQIGDSFVMVEDEFPDRATKAPPAGADHASSFLFIYVEDVDGGHRSRC